MSNRRKFLKENLNDEDEDDTTTLLQPQLRHSHQRSKSWLTQQKQSSRNDGTRLLRSDFILGAKRGRGRGGRGGRGGGRGGGVGGVGGGRGGGASSAKTSTSSIVANNKISPTSFLSSCSQYSLPTSSSSSSKKVISRYYSVEDILGRREYQGKIEYLLKWQGYPDRFNSWETVDNLTQDLIIEFELSNPAMETLSKEPKEAVFLKDTPIKIWDIRKSKDEQLEYFVQWKNEPDFEWVDGTIMRQAFPSLVIEFYESISKLVD